MTSSWMPLPSLPLLVERLEKPPFLERNNQEAQRVERQSGLRVEKCRQDIEMGIRIMEKDEVDALQECLMGNVQ